MKTKRAYQSRRRAAQVDETRRRIIEGLVATMATGVATLSIPAVAHAAGVSVPTVYRHFRSKRELLAALGPYVAAKLGLSAARLPRSPAELAAQVRDLYVNAEGLDETLRVAAVSELGNQFRALVRPARVELIEGALAPVSGQLDDRDRLRLRNVVLILTSSAVMRAFKDYLDLSGEAAADNIVWALQTLVRAVAPAIGPGDGS